MIESKIMGQKILIPAKGNVSAVQVASTNSKLWVSTEKIQGKVKIASFHKSEKCIDNLI